MMNGGGTISATALLLLAVMAMAGVPLGTAGCHGVARDTTAAGLEAEHWKLVLLPGHTIRTGNNRESPYLVFDPARHRASGSSGCNGFSGKYVLDGDQVEFTEIISTKMACEGLMEQESAYFNALAATARWNRSGSRLELYDTTGKVLAAFEDR